MNHSGMSVADPCSACPEILADPQDHHPGSSADHLRIIRSKSSGGSGDKLPGEMGLV